MIAVGGDPVAGAVGVIALQADRRVLAGDDLAVAENGVGADRQVVIAADGACCIAVDGTVLQADGTTRGVNAATGSSRRGIARDFGVLERHAPLGIDAARPLVPVFTYAVLVLALTMVASAASLVVRFRRAGPVAMDHLAGPALWSP